MGEKIVQNADRENTVQRKPSKGMYYFLCALACLAFASSIFWIVTDLLFNMPGKLLYVFLGIIAGISFLRLAKRIVKK